MKGIDLADLANSLTPGRGYDTPEWRKRLTEHDAWLERFLAESLAFERELLSELARLRDDGVEP